MASVPIDSRVDVTVSLGTQPISTASFDSALFLADIETGGEGDLFNGDLYRIYNTLDGLVADNFPPEHPAYKVASLVFGGKFPASALYVVNINEASTAGNYMAAIGDFYQVNSTPYYVMADTRNAVTAIALAGFCEATNRMFIHATDEVAVVNPAITEDVASVLKDNGYDHALTLFTDTLNDEYPQAGVVGAMAAIPAGTSTLEDKTLVGVTATMLTATERNVCESKNVAYYSPIAGVNSLFNSKVASGQYFDTIVFSDWLQARLSEEIYGLLKRESDLGRKVAMDSTGFAKVRQACWNVIRIGQANGSVSPDIEPVVRTPNREDISAADKANRVLPDVVVELLYSGAIHKVLVRAYVTV